MVMETAIRLLNMELSRVEPFVLNQPFPRENRLLGSAPTSEDRLTVALTVIRAAKWLAPYGVHVVRHVYKVGKEKGNNCLTALCIANTVPYVTVMLGMHAHIHNNISKCFSLPLVVWRGEIEPDIHPLSITTYPV